MKFSAGHLKRYQQIVSLLWRYGRSDLVHQMSTEDGFGPHQIEGSPSDLAPHQLADDLEAMGPTYVKIGQVLAGFVAGALYAALRQRISRMHC